MRAIASRPAVRNAAFNLGGQALPMVVALVAMPVLVAEAGTERLGFLGLAWALIGYFALLDLGLSRVVTRRVAVADAAGTLAVEIGILKRLCVQLFVAVAAISAVLAMVVPASAVIGRDAGPALEAEAGIALLILWATLPLTVVTGLLRGALEGLQSFGRVNVLRAFFGTWSFAAPLCVLPWSHELAALTAAIAAGRVLSLVAHGHWAFDALAARQRQRPAHAAAPTRAHLTAMFREGGWLTVSNVVGPMMVTFDRFVIAALVSLAAASYYFVPQEISLRLLIVPSAIAATIFPMLARSGAGVGHQARIADGALSAVVATCLPLCAVIATFADPLLTAWMGEAFAQSSARVATLLAVGLFANCCAQVPFAWIQAAGRSDITGKLHLLQLPVYAVLLVALTMRFGIEGAAVAWSVRASADALLLFVASRSLVPEVPIAALVGPVLAGCALLIAIASSARPIAFASLFACCVLSCVLLRRLHRSLRG